jgi:hypothetical protein
MNTIIDHLGLTWTRSEDGRTLTCEDGRIVYGDAYMPNEHLLYFAYLDGQENAD